MTERSIVRVADVMEQDYAIVDGVATVAEALAVMRQQNARFLIVAKRHEDDEFGIVMIADIAKQVLARNRSPERTNVYEIMSKPVLAVDADMGLKYAVRLLDRFGVSRALVTDRGELVGMVTMRDMVLRYLGADAA